MASTAKLIPPNSELSSDCSYQLATSQATMTDVPDSTMLHTSEVRYIQSHGTKERIELEQRVLDKLEKLTNHRVDFGQAKRPKTHESLKLTSEQAYVHQMAVQRGVSMFFTGAAGTGKSILLTRIIQDLKIKYSGLVAVTASTGIAACAIGGRTVHSWAGVGLGKGDPEKLVQTVRRSPTALTRWKKCHCLIIDEVSMLNPELLDALDYIGQKIRKSKLPFGGLQVIFTGDFFQLPPVDKEKKSKDARSYAFDAKCWPKAVTKTILLTQVFRQTDHTFQRMLQEARYGQISTETAKIFASLNRPPPNMPKDITPTRLFSRRYEVERANNVALQQIDEKQYVFKAYDHVYPPPEGTRRHLDLSKVTWMAPDKVVLKKGAQVMMIKNVDETLVNGSIGKIIAWVAAPTMPPSIVESKTVMDISALVNEVHRCDDQKLKRLEKSLNANDGKGEVHESQDLLSPLVRFFNRNGTIRDVILQKETWNYENEFGEVVASRTQLPLILAYALSVHKSQGQTLDYVQVDLSSAFEVGQAYVALSRATHLEGLHLKGFNPAKVKCDPRVAKFYDGLERVKQPNVTDMFHKMQKRTLSETESHAAKESEHEEEEEEEEEEAGEPEPDYKDLLKQYQYSAPDAEMKLETSAESIAKPDPLHPPAKAPRVLEPSEGAAQIKMSSDTDDGFVDMPLYPIKRLNEIGSSSVPGQNMAGTGAAPTTIAANPPSSPPVPANQNLHPTAELHCPGVSKDVDEDLFVQPEDVLMPPVKEDQPSDGFDSEFDEFKFHERFRRFGRD